MDHCACTNAYINNNIAQIILNTTTNYSQTMVIQSKHLLLKPIVIQSKHILPKPMVIQSKHILLKPVVIQSKHLLKPVVIQSKHLLKSIVIQSKHLLSMKWYNQLYIMLGLGPGVRVRG